MKMYSVMLRVLYNKYLVVNYDKVMSVNVQVDLDNEGCKYYLDVCLREEKVEEL